MTTAEQLGASFDGGVARVPIDGVEVELMATSQSTGLLTTRPVTCTRVPMPDQPLGFRNREPTEGMGKLVTGDDAFDRAFVCVGPPEAVAWFTGHVRAAMLHLSEIRLFDGELQVTVPGHEEDLDDMRDQLVQTAFLAKALRWDPDDHVEKLVHGLTDPLPPVRLRSLRTLAELDPSRAAQVAPLTDPDPNVRLLAATCADDPGVVIDMLLDPAWPQAILDDAAMALAAASLQSWLTDAHSAALVQLAASNHRGTYVAALDALASVGGIDAIEPLRALADEAGFLSTRRRRARSAVAAILSRSEPHRGGVSVARSSGALSEAPPEEPDKP